MGDGERETLTPRQLLTPSQFLEFKELSVPHLGLPFLSPSSSTTI